MQDACEDSRTGKKEVCKMDSSEFQDYAINSFASYDAAISDIGKDINTLKRAVVALNRKLKDGRPRNDIDIFEQIKNDELEMNHDYDSDDEPNLEEYDEEMDWIPQRMEDE